jgi:hypothetical protein
MSRKKEPNQNAINEEWVDQGTLIRTMFRIPFVALVIVNDIMIVSNESGLNGFLIGVSIGAVLL